VLSDTFSEGKLKDLRSSFPLDQPTELDDYDFLDDSDLEDVEDEDDAKPPTEMPGATSENRKSSVCATQSMDPGTHFGKVVVLRDISFVT